MVLISRCKKCGCKISYGKKWCEKCEPKKLRQKRLSTKLYDETGRDKKKVEFYRGKDWSETRERVKELDHGLCVMCLRNNRIEYSDVVHHIDEIEYAWSKRLDVDNLVCLCHTCHERVHAMYKNIYSKEEMQVILHMCVSERQVGMGDIGGIRQ